MVDDRSSLTIVDQKEEMADNSLTGDCFYYNYAVFVAALSVA